MLDQPKICRTLPRVRNKHLLAELENHGIVLTDIGEETPPIRLLLGADVLGRILSGTIQFYVENKILKIRSRLILGQDPEDFVRPTVLPDHPIIRRLIAYAHKTLHHAGVETTLSHLRERFGFLGSEGLLKRINRVAAFEVTGADLAGPIYLKGGEKAWIEIFTCAVYRALHLELVTSLSTEAFMQAMRRIFARRRRSSIMYTDNGTNFWGTSRTLSNLNLQEIIAECAIQNIKWHFNPPAAPWCGGWWERMICIIKQLLRNVLGRACVTYEEMVTLLCECESVVNECPLTYLYDDPNELRAIKPPDFTQDIKGNETVDLDIVDAKYLRKRIRYLQNLRCQLRQRFQKEYLAELIRNPKLPSKRHNLSPGDVVLVDSDNTKRLNWPLGRVIELFQGKDNIERVAKLRVANWGNHSPNSTNLPLRNELN
ncbi:hypothetical protein AVEN_31986-1 [Araneus ventricosus]|uniref:Integrase catalytic domain-containing protein n=1 Tax=Araneus ventricosus TaxID=182803 RepID=A0A4Y2UKN0_ARAVE|nr:hypothetical protein AVEN_137886-1 [Araneus ventricosus]GBO12100.1 hypothetical protein AVEN_31986-1 [Araneus ventricosus]